MSNAPERIWAWPFNDWYRGGCSTAKVVVAGSKDVEYILATPERELASELVETLREIVSAYDEMVWGEDYEYVAAANIMQDKARAVLAKLDKGE